MDEEEFLNPTMCRRCNRNALLEYEYEFTCYVCEFNVIKTKNQLTKVQRKKNINFKGRLTYATPEIIGICMEVNSLVQTNDIVVLAAVLIYLKKKRLNIIEEILKKFDDMPDDFETNPFAASEGIHKAGDYTIRMMKWLISARYYEYINYYDLIATTLRYMKGEQLFVRKEVFFFINE